MNTKQVSTITKKAITLIEFNSKSYLAKKLGVSRNTLDSRLEKDNWKNSEIQMILTLSK